MSEELSALTATEHANNTCRYAATEAKVPVLATHDIRIPLLIAIVCPVIPDDSSLPR